jgi:hypothetical protein
MKARFIFFIHFLVIFCGTLGAQGINQDSIHFKEFISFFPERDYPITISPDYDKTTPFKRPLNQIPADLYKLYVCKQGLLCKSDYCPDSKFLGFMAFGTFPSFSDFKVVLIAYDLDDGCEQKWYLLTYNRNGQLIDKLLFYAEGFLELPKEDNLVERTYSVEGTIMQDSIFTVRQEKTYNRKTKAKTVNTTNNAYVLNAMGQFIKVKAK